MLVALLVLFATHNITLVPGSSMTWTDGTYTWAGSKLCVNHNRGVNFTLLPTAPAIDKGQLRSGFHCSAAGPSTTGCREWYGAAPDLGSCEYVKTTAPSPVNPPSSLGVKF